MVGVRSSHPPATAERLRAAGIKVIEPSEETTTVYPLRKRGETGEQEARDPEE